jgi:hypothetical protein
LTRIYGAPQIPKDVLRLLLLDIDRDDRVVDDLQRKAKERKLAMAEIKDWLIATAGSRYLASRCNTCLC